MPGRGLTQELLGFFVGRPQCEMVEAAYVPDRHLHKEIECVYVLQGRLDVRVGEWMARLNSGEFLLIPGNMIHEFQHKTLEDHVVRLKFMQEWMLPDFLGAEEKEQFRNLLSYAFRVSANPDMARLMEETMQCRFIAKYWGYKEYVIFAKIAELLALFLSHPELVVEKEKAHLHHPRYLDAMLSYIHQHADQRITLPMLARHIGITESYCSKYMKQNTGLSFVEYVNAVRINRAQRLLIYTDMSIGEVMEGTGFSSIQTFNRVFRSQTGRSPTEYRQSKRTDAQGLQDTDDV